MRKIINNPKDFVDETMDGIIAAYGDRLKLHNGDRRVLLSNYPAREGKVGIVTAGGSGHLPVFLGYVGSGLLGWLRRWKRVRLSFRSEDGGHDPCLRQGKRCALPVWQLRR